MKAALVAVIATVSVAPAFSDGLPSEGRGACLGAARQQSELQAGELDAWTGIESERNSMGEWLVIFTYEFNAKPVLIRCLWNPETGGIVLGAFGETIYDTTK